MSSSNRPRGETRQRSSFNSSFQALPACRDAEHASFLNVLVLIYLLDHASTFQSISPWIFSTQDLSTIANYTASSPSDYIHSHNLSWLFHGMYVSTLCHKTKCYYQLDARKVQLKNSNAYYLLSRARLIRISLSKPFKIDLLCLISIISTREMPSPLSRLTLHVTPRSRRSPSSKFLRTGLPRMLSIRC